MRTNYENHLEQTHDTSISSGYVQTNIPLSGHRSPCYQATGIWLNIFQNHISQHLGCFKTPLDWPIWMCLKPRASRVTQILTSDLCEDPGTWPKKQLSILLPKIEKNMSTSWTFLLVFVVFSFPRCGEKLSEIRGTSVARSTALLQRMDSTAEYMVREYSKWSRVAWNATRKRSPFSKIIHGLWRMRTCDWLFGVTRLISCWPCELNWPSKINATWNLFSFFTWTLLTHPAKNHDLGILCNI